MTVPLQATGWLYGAIALYLGGIFLQKAWALLQQPSDRDQARSLFKFSILYMMALSAGMVLDSLPITREALGTFTDQVYALTSTLMPLFLG
jgi:protoheme IX farnesyltransferase